MVENKWQEKFLLLLILSFIFIILGLCWRGQSYLKTDGDIELPKHPKRIISLSLSCDEILTSLVDHQRILALTYLACDPGISNITEDVSDIKNFIRSDPEKIIEMQPDLVISSSITNPHTVRLLKSAKIPVVVYRQSDSLEGIKNNIRYIAEAVGEKEKGEELIDSFVFKEQEKSDLTCLYYGFSGDIAGKGTQFDEILNLAGFQNAASSIKGRKMINKEKLLELNPDVIFVPIWASSMHDFNSMTTVDKILNDPALVELKAVKTLQVYPLVDSHITCSSHYILQGYHDLSDVREQILKKEKKSR